MNSDELKKSFGEEYPAAMVFDGVRMPLALETRFTRIYSSPSNRKESHYVSRFMDGSASITLSQLKNEWPRWTDSDRMDFCGASVWLHEQSDFPDMLRFIMEHSGPNEWSAVALSVSGHLPQEEAFDVLLRALGTMDMGKTSNITQAIAKTKHPAAETTLRNHLRSIWAHAALWDDDDFLNWIAFDATTCIEHLVELGAPSSDFEEQVRKLSRHACSGNRDSCRNYLAKYYPWLK